MYKTQRTLSEAHASGCVIFLVVVASVMASNAEAGNYRYVRIGGDELLESMTPSLNSTGQVAFLARLPGQDTGVVLAGDENGLVEIAETWNAYSGYVDAPRISDNGSVAFWRGHSIYTGNGGPLTLIADESSDFYILFRPLSINASGNVAFAADPTFGEFRGIFIGNGGSTELVVGSGGDLAGNLESPSMSDSGAVAFAGGLYPMSSYRRAVFLTKNGVNRTVFSMKTWGVGDEIGFPSLNNNDSIAFRAHFPSGVQAILVSNGDSTFTFIDNTGPFDRLGRCELNDLGQIAFTATLDTGLAGIFTGPDPVRDRVVGIGDPLAGSIVTGFDLGSGFNERGQIAFMAALADGQRVVFRADPVPEPRTLSLLVCLALAFQTRARQRRRDG